jgi:hypothetical protein
VRDAIDFEAMGIPSAVVVADALLGPSDAMRRVSGLPEYPLLVTEFPVGSCTADELAVRADRLVDAMVSALYERSGDARARSAADEAPAASLFFASEHDAVEAYTSLGWTDGLPIVAPTRERVDALLDTVTRASDDIVVCIPTRDGLSATLHDVAVNAVMAGCTPELFPVVVAAMDAMSDPAHNLHAHTGTMAGAQQLVVINGPQRHRLGFRTTDGGLGPGWRANQSVGRSARLVIRNALGSVHGEFDRAGFSHPGRVGWCVAEDEERSPWPPIATQASDMATGVDAVTVYATVWQASVICHDQDAEVLLDELALATRTGCHVNWLHADVASDSAFFARRPFLFVTGHEHARVLARHGYDDLDRLRRALYARLTGADSPLRPAAVSDPRNIHIAYLHATGMQQTWFFAPFQSHHLVSRTVAP